MTSLSFPDVNVLLALVSHDHIHSLAARNWLEQQTGTVGIVRATQQSFLRLVTTAAAMNGHPLTNDAAWRLHDRFYEDSRIILFPEPPEAERFFRSQAASGVAAPKLWADAWLLAFAQAAGGTVITFDRALAQRGAHCLV